MHLKELHSTCCLSRHFYFNINIISSKSSIFLDAYLLYNIESSTRFTSASWRCVKHFICHRKLISQIIYIFLRELLRPDQNKKLLFLRLSSVFNRNITTCTILTSVIDGRFLLYLVCVQYSIIKVRSLYN